MFKRNVHIKRNRLKRVDHIAYATKARKLSHHGRYSGGVIVLVRKCLSKYVDRVAVDADNTVVLKLDKGLLGTTKDVVYIGLYIPPYDSNYWKTTIDGYELSLWKNVC